MLYDKSSHALHPRTINRSRLRLLDYLFHKKRCPTFLKKSVSGLRLQKIYNPLSLKYILLLYPLKIAHFIYYYYFSLH